MNYVRGSVSLFVLIIGVVIAITIGGLVALAGTQYMVATRTELYGRALGVAEAGAEYYRWRLSHNSSDYQGGTFNLTDPYGNTTGMYQLTIQPPANGSSIVTVLSTGWMTSHPEIKRTIKVRLGKQSYARYAFLHNANIWFGAKITIHGKVFSNGGIRMEGTNDSTMQSAKQTYTCGDETGCSPPETKPGIWGSGGPQNLWEFPVVPIVFKSIVVDFTNMQKAADQNGLYLKSSKAYGYHVIFKPDGSYTVNKVTQVVTKKGWSVEGGCESLGQVINRETLVGNYTINTKPIVFIEDNLWVEGTIKGRVTVVAAKLPIDLYSMNIWLPNSVVYAAKDGTSALGLIAQNNITFSLGVPQTFEVDGALLAQNGRVLRHNYKYQGCSMLPEAVRQNLIMYGSLISNQKSYWNYGNSIIIGFGNGPVSGFMQRDVTYDPNLLFQPPPYFPSEQTLTQISWEEQ